MKAGALQPAIAQRVIRRLAQSTDRILWTAHIRQRMRERGIFEAMVLSTLRQGYVEDEPVSVKGRDEWRAKIVSRQPEGRSVGIVVVVTSSESLILITAEREDIR